MKIPAFLLILTFLANLAGNTFAQNHARFSEIKLLQADGDSTTETSVIVEFSADSMTITAKDRRFNKTFPFSEIKAAEYSYSKNPRWKTGLGLGAASILFPPLLLVAVPLGFSKHRRHWLTVRTEKDFAVLKLSKSVRKIFIPAFETKTGVKVEALGENK